MSMATSTDAQSPALHVADSHESIRVHGARVNNLKDVSVEIPKRRLTAFTGRLVDSGQSVIVIEHHQAVMAHTDWIIDLGPGAGHDGGRIVFEGTPAEIVTGRPTLTGEHLAAYVGG
jgi:excinuclease UvrABC ATPase subunit